jgi:hypothetical protein
VKSPKEWQVKWLVIAAVIVAFVWVLIKTTSSIGTSVQNAVKSLQDTVNTAWKATTDGTTKIWEDAAPATGVVGQLSALVAAPTILGTQIGEWLGNLISPGTTLSKGVATGVTGGAIFGQVGSGLGSGASSSTWMQGEGDSTPGVVGSITQMYPDTSANVPIG